jgi:protein-disulfide isomerase
LLGLGIVAALIIFTAILLFNRSQPGPVRLTAAEQERLVREDSPSRGPVDAQVTLVEFLDPECESCRAAHPEVEQILEEYEGRIRYVVRYFPNHNNSTLAVAATEAAGEQGRYWEMQAMLFVNQPEWGERATPQTDHFIRYASELGLDVEQFTASLQNPEYVAIAERDRQDALALGLRGTPTFFVNGQLVYGMNGQMLRTLIDQGLQE